MYKLVCRVEHFHDPILGRRIHKGEAVTEQDQVARLSEDREHEFVRVTMTPDEEKAETARQHAAAPPSTSVEPR